MAFVSQLGNIMQFLDLDQQGSDPQDPHQSAGIRSQTIRFAGQSDGCKNGTVLFGAPCKKMYNPGGATTVISFGILPTLEDAQSSSDGHSP